jgi:hypothetical protein
MKERCGEFGGRGWRKIKKDKPKERNIMNGDF